jgi:Interferon-induced transmembrane protein/zinc-ribbon domain
MFCSQCGANNPDTAAVCAQCGRNLQAVTPATPLQPTGVVLPPGTTVQNYLVFAILATVFCCLPTGIPAIIFAAQVNGKLQAGDVAGAQVASKNAKMWCLISLGLGLGLMALYAILVMVGVLSGIHQNR